MLIMDMKMNFNVWHSQICQKCKVVSRAKYSSSKIKEHFNKYSYLNYSILDWFCENSIICKALILYR